MVIITLFIINFLKFKEQSFINKFACINDDIPEKESIMLSNKVILFLFEFRLVKVIEGIENSIIPCIRREIWEVNKLDIILQGMLKRTMIPSIFIRVSKE